MELRRVKFIHNPTSGLIRSPLIIRKLITSSLNKAPFEYDFEETRYRGHAHEMAKAASQNGYDAVVAVGGDGTVNEVATALLYTDTTAGIIPIGSGNGLARNMNIPLSINRATRLLVNGRVRTIDAGKIEDRTFFIVTGMGFDAVVGKIFDEGNIRGPLPYFYIGFREFLFYKPEVFILKFDGKQVAIPALLVTIANQRQWGVGAIIAPDAHPDDGYLDVCVLHRVKLGYALFHLPKIFTGKIDKIRKYERYRVKSVQIIREKPGPFHYDGEPVDAGTHLHISIQPQALRLIVPK
ncbi:MAG TPA: diacylglycerol kinase family lipid kinase [bacterium]|nr:diacylglycerol kinase family lipid kinase [bacterium]HPN42840.1 diacylglycerol kinase family lipid kinase [bacterium]